MPQISWQYGQFGPGGGSFPSNVMRTGQIGPFNPVGVRHDVEANFVRDATEIPVAHRPRNQAMMPTGSMGGTLLGATPQGRPLRKFDLPGTPTPRDAKGAAQALKRAAGLLAQNKLFGLSPALIGGPLASVASGEAAVLRWPNGIQIGVQL